MDYIIAKKSTANKVLRPEGNPSQEELTDEKGIYNAILAQYIPILINDCGQTQYTEYIERSINLGWKNRDKERNLTNKSWSELHYQHHPCLLIQLPVFLH